MTKDALQDAVIIEADGQYRRVVSACCKSAALPRIWTITFFSIPVFWIGESLIPGSRGNYNDSGISDSSVLNPGIKKTGTGLEVLDYRFAIMSTSRTRKINYFDCIFGNDCCNAIDRIPEQET